VAPVFYPANSIHIVHPCIRLEYVAILVDAPFVSDAPFYGAQIWYGGHDVFLTKPANDSNNIARLFPLIDLGSHARIHNLPAFAIRIPVAKYVFIPVVMTEPPFVVVLIYNRNELSDLGLILRSGIKENLMPDAGHHVAEAQNLGRIRAPAIISGHLRMGK